MTFDNTKKYETSPTGFSSYYWNVLKEISENPGTKLIIMLSTPETNVGQLDAITKTALRMNR